MREIKSISDISQTIEGYMLAAAIGALSTIQGKSSEDVISALYDIAKRNLEG